MRPTIGRLVHYSLTEGQAAAANRRRTNGSSIADRIAQDKWPLGAQAHIGNAATAGDIVPFIIVRVWPDEYGPGVDGVNGQAMLDGNDCLWITSAKEGTDSGTWRWPPRT